MRRYLLLPALILLGSCGEVVTDTGFACLLPEQIECMCPYDEECEPGIDPVLVTSWTGECTGRYSSEATHELEVFLREAGGGNAGDIECSVAIGADHVLSVSASYRQLPDRDDMVEPEVIATCEVPPLEPGTWTLEYGSGSVSFVVGDPEIQPMACANAGRR